MGLGELIHARRRVKRWTQAALAAICCVDRSYISNLEHGRAVPSPLTLLALSRALDLDLGELTKLAAAVRPPLGARSAA